MAVLLHPRARPVYPAAEQVVRRVLRQGRALFSTGISWRAPELDDLLARVRTASSDGEGTWGVRWEQVLDGVGDDGVQLAAEALYVHLLFPDDLRPATKRALVGATLARMATPPVLPDLLDAALDGGVAGTGIAFTRRRLSQLAFLLSAVAAWRDAAPQVRRIGLADPWAFKSWLWSVPPAGGQAQREALLHLVHPAAFEPIISRGVKRQIVDGFGLDAPDADADRALAVLRDRLIRRHGEGFTFIDADVALQWRR